MTGPPKSRGRRIVASVALGLGSMLPAPVYFAVDCHANIVVLELLAALGVVGMGCAGFVAAGRGRPGRAVLIALAFVPPAVGVWIVGFAVGFQRCFTF